MMKRIFLLFSLMLAVGITKAQGLNEQLYSAVDGKDTLAVEKLLNSGADANYKRKTGAFEASLLISAVMNNDFRTVKLLVDHNAQVNWKDWFHTSALMYAAYKGNFNIVKYLLDKGADIHAKDEQGNTVLSSAKEGNHPEVIKLVEGLLGANAN